MAPNVSRVQKGTHKSADHGMMHDAVNEPGTIPAPATLIGLAQMVRSQLADCLGRIASAEYALSGRADGGESVKDSPPRTDCLGSILSDCQNMVNDLNEKLATLNQEIGG